MHSCPSYQVHLFVMGLYETSIMQVAELQIFEVNFYSFSSFSGINMVIHFIHSTNCSPNQALIQVPCSYFCLFCLDCPASTFCSSGHITLIFLWIILHHILHVELFLLPGSRDGKATWTFLVLWHMTGSGVDTGQNIS